jgi:hypothetical protein
VLYAVTFLLTLPSPVKSSYQKLAFWPSGSGCARPLLALDCKNQRFIDADVPAPGDAKPNSSAGLRENSSAQWYAGFASFQAKDHSFSKALLEGTHHYRNLVNSRDRELPGGYPLLEEVVRGELRIDVLGWLEELPEQQRQALTLLSRREINCDFQP